MSKFNVLEHAGPIHPAVLVCVSGISASFFGSALETEKHKCLVPKWILRSSGPTRHFTDGETEATSHETTWSQPPEASEDSAGTGTQISRFPDNCCAPALRQLSLHFRMHAKFL